MTVHPIVHSLRSQTRRALKISMFDASDARLCAGSIFETNNGNPIVAQLGCVPLGKLKNVYYTKNERHHVPTWFPVLVIAWPKYACSIVLAYVCAPTSSGAIKLGGYLRSITFRIYNICYNRFFEKAEDTHSAIFTNLDIRKIPLVCARLFLFLVDRTLPRAPEPELSLSFKRHFFAIDNGAVWGRRSP